MPPMTSPIPSTIWRSSRPANELARIRAGRTERPVATVYVSALRAASADALRRYDIEPRVLEAYLERWTEIRRDRVEREARQRRTRGFVRRLAEEHRWPGI